MIEEKEKLEKELAKNIKKNFESNSFKDNFFTEILKSFSHRYFENQKNLEIQTSIIDTSTYESKVITHTMKRVLELIGTNERPILLDKMKELVGQYRPHALQRLIIDSTSINDNGHGKLKVKLDINWDYPQFKSLNSSIKKEYIFESTDWEYLRKKFPLKLDDICDFF